MHLFLTEMHIAAGTGDHEGEVECYLDVSAPNHDGVEEVGISFTTLEAEDADGTIIASREFDRHGFLMSGGNCRGDRSFLSYISKEEVASFKGGRVTFHIAGTVQSVKMASTAQAGSSGMLCAVLKNLEDHLSQELGHAWRNKYLLSPRFRNSLGHQVQSRQGGLGLPGAFSPYVPQQVINDLCAAKLPKALETYSESVHRAMSAAVKDTVSSVVPQSQLPKLHHLYIRKATEVMDRQKAELDRDWRKVLQWEQLSLHTSNHYYMSIVQSLRGRLFESSEPEGKEGSGEEACPDAVQDTYIGFMGLTAESVNSMSNEEQEVVDLQIKVFAYWKMMKKRLLDYVQLAARTDLAVLPFTESLLKDGLREALEEAASRQTMAVLLSPSPEIGERRAEVHGRLANLREAEYLIAEQIC